MSTDIVVTGGAGFIGSNVVDRFIGEGFSVCVIDNLSTGRPENLNPAARFYRADICDRKEVERIFAREKPDYVNHHAAQIDVRRSVDNPCFDASVNILGSINLLEASRRAGVKKFVYISTGGAIYGEPERLPADENCPVRPISAYGISKHTVEHYLYFFLHNWGLNYTVLRYANVYGPRQDPKGEAGVIAIFTDMMFAGGKPVIFGSGEQTRDYIFAEDVVEANILALGRGDGEIYNIGTGMETTVNGIFEALSSILDYRGEAVFSEGRKGEVERISLDNRKAKEELGWEPKYGLEEGLKKTVEYYREHGSSGRNS